jgi:hypothetical protein
MGSQTMDILSTTQSNLARINTLYRLRKASQHNQQTIQQLQSAELQIASLLAQEANVLQNHLNDYIKRLENM